jgi:hypothetical protein
MGLYPRKSRPPGQNAFVQAAIFMLPSNVTMKRSVFDNEKSVAYRNIRSWTPYLHWQRICMERFNKTNHAASWH